MSRKSLLSLLCLFLFCLALYASNPLRTANSDTYIIRLKWNKAYADEHHGRVETGLKWLFSFLGASVPKGSMKKALTWEGDIAITDLGQLGFSSLALQEIGKIVVKIKASQEYQKNSALDIGRFVVLTLNTPEHYYAITGAQKNIDAILSRYQFDTSKICIVESCVSKAARIISMSIDTAGNNYCFIAHEGSSSSGAGNFKTKEYEVLRMMANGQLGFAIYNEDGQLIPASDKALTSAGKVGNCLWCHETNIGYPFYAKTAVPGYATPDMFKSIARKTQDDILLYRSSLNSDIDFSELTEHALTELLYISFMEPSAERLSYEWHMHIDSVKQRLKKIPTHTHTEFAFLGTLYHRKDVDPLAPYSSIRVAESARESSAYEPDLLKQ